MAKGYWVSVFHSIDDADKYSAYAKLAGPATAAGGGKLVARGEPARAYEAGKLQRVVVVEFESVAAAIACHDGPAYQAALKALDGGVTRDLRIVEGVE